jgi:hypothetical protein
VFGDALASSEDVATLSMACRSTRGEDKSLAISARPCGLRLCYGKEFLDRMAQNRFIQIQDSVLTPIDKCKQTIDWARSRQTIVDMFNAAITLELTMATLRS